MEETSQNIPAQTPRTILLVDDEQSILKALSIMLEARGYVVFATGDPFHARAIFETHKIDAAIFDVCLPGIDGIQLAGMIRSSSPETAILLMSAHPDSPLTAKARTMFGDHFLDKSELQETLLQRVDALLRRCEMPDNNNHPQT